MPDTPAPPLTAAQLAVLARWNPAGARLLGELDSHNLSPAVYFTGPESDELGAELCARVPGLRVSDSPIGATVAVVALPAAAPPSVDHLRAALDASDAGCQVLFAMTGIDRNRDWREARRSATDQLLARSGQAEAPQIWPVAPGLAATSRDWPDPAQAGLVDACSGLAELHAALDTALAAPAKPRAGTIAAAAVAHALHRIAKIRADLADTSEDSALRAERSRLALRRDGGRGEAASTVRSALALARVDLLHDAGASLRALNTTAREEVDQTGRKRLASYPQRLQQHVSALASNTAARASARLAAVASQAGLAPVPSEPPPEPTTGPGPESRRGSLEDQMILVTGASAGVGLGRLAVSPLALNPALDYATWPATLLLGGGAAWWLTRSRKHLAARAAMRQWVTDALVNVKSELEQQLIAAIVRAETALSSQIVKESSDRTVAVDAQLAAIDAELRSRVARRQSQAQACDRDKAVLLGR